jgi:hypothetical protein
MNEIGTNKIKYFILTLKDRGNEGKNESGEWDIYVPREND